MGSKTSRTQKTAFILCGMLISHVLGGRPETEVKVELQMTKWVTRGGSVRLRCVHDVPPELLDKVVFLRQGTIIFQYIKDRKPPYRNFTTIGAVLNLALATQNSIVLQNLEFSAAGTYSCEVSLQTPIFTKASSGKQLIVIQPQRHRPRIEVLNIPSDFNNNTIEITCTTAPSLPPPHVTWFLNGVKTEASAVESFRYKSSGNTNRHVIHRKHRSYSTGAVKVCQVKENLKDASATLKNLKSGHSELWFTISTIKIKLITDILHTECISTIPEFKGLNGKYADIKNDSITVEALAPSTQDTNVSLDMLSTPAEISTSSGALPFVGSLCIVCSFVVIL